MAAPIKKKSLLKSTLWLSLGIICASALAYGAFYFKGQRPDETDIANHKQTAQAWYKTHAKAPELVRLPDAPLILAAKEAEIDPSVREITPKKPLRKPKAQLKPRLNDITLAPKPETPVIKTPVYEEALPQDIYTPSIPVQEITTPQINTPKAVPVEPVITTLETNKPRWMQFALNITPHPERPMIALVIDDMGLDRKRTAQTIALSGPMTMAFIPYAKNLSRQTEQARTNGHELLVHLPMEPLNDKIDAGPNHLNTHLAHEDLLERIHWNLERFSGYVGVNNHMGSKATTDNTVMQALMEELRTRELLFLDSRTNPKSVGATIASKEGVPFAERNVFLDNVNDKDAVFKQLDQLEKLSRKHGFAVGIGHPRDGTIAALKEWLPKAGDKGFTLVPISQIVMKKQGLS